MANHAIGQAFGFLGLALAVSSSVAVAAEVPTPDFPPPEQVKLALRAMPELRAPLPQVPNFPHLSNGDVFLIYAHADDELPTFAAVAELRRRYPGTRVHWLLVSDNGRGQIARGACRPRESAVRCRYREAARAARCSRLERPVSLGLPDGGLDGVPDLASRIRAKVDELRDDRGVAAVFTHDEAGLYGHADHVAVHDAVRRGVGDLGAPLVTAALPQFLRSVLTRRPPGSERPFPPISHVYDLSARDLEVMDCATQAHASQAPTLRSLLLGLTPREFWSSTPRQYLHLSD